VLIDRTHRLWFFFAIAALLAGGALYAAYTSLSVQGPRGGSVPGLVFASIGSAFMVFAGLLGARKKFMLWRVGRTTTWMRAHLWLGFLSFPFILFHSGFAFGAGPLTRTLMVLLTLVFISGLFGAVVQHFMPRLMTERVPMETVYEQIDRIRLQLLDEAQSAIDDICGALQGELRLAGEQRRAIAASAGTRGDLTYASGLGTNEQAANAIKEFFAKEVRPFILQVRSTKPSVAEAERATALFAQLRLLLPRDLWPKLDQVENICEEKRQLDRQRRMHNILHGWLLLHIPASYAVLLLGAVHAVYALRY